MEDSENHKICTRVITLPKTPQGPCQASKGHRLNKVGPAAGSSLNDTNSMILGD